MGTAVPVVHYLFYCLSENLNAYVLDNEDQHVLVHIGHNNQHF